jgi:hypothetical protein
VQVIRNRKFMARGSHAPVTVHPHVGISDWGVEGLRVAKRGGGMGGVMQWRGRR